MAFDRGSNALIKRIAKNTGEKDNNNNLFSLSCTSTLLLCSLPHVSYVTIILFWMKARRTVGLRPVHLGGQFPEKIQC